MKAQIKGYYVHEESTNGEYLGVHPPTNDNILDFVNDLDVYSTQEEAQVCTDELNKSWNNKRPASKFKVVRIKLTVELTNI